MASILESMLGLGELGAIGVHFQSYCGKGFSLFRYRYSVVIVLRDLGFAGLCLMLKLLIKKK